MFSFARKEHSYKSTLIEIGYVWPIRIAGIVAIMIAFLISLSGTSQSGVNVQVETGMKHVEGKTIIVVIVLILFSVLNMVYAIKGIVNDSIVPLYRYYQSNAEPCFRAKSPIMFWMYALGTLLVGFLLTTIAVSLLLRK
jgi:hypothetical protein